jgi:hypothetical protein
LEFAECRLAVLDGDAELHRRQGGPEVGGHVTQVLRLVSVESTPFRSQAGEERLEVGPDVQVGIGLDQQRCRAVLAPDDE